MNDINKTNVWSQNFICKRSVLPFPKGQHNYKKQKQNQNFSKHNDRINTIHSKKEKTKRGYRLAMKKMSFQQKYDTFDSLYEIRVNSCSENTLS